MEPLPPSTSPPLPCAVCGWENVVEARFCNGCGSALQWTQEQFRSRIPSIPPQGGGSREGTADPLVGRLIAERYRIVALLGRGGMGVVYKVEHVHIGKLMAMKLLHGELAQNKSVLKSLRREAEVVSKLSHPNTVQVFDFGRSQGLVYLVMEYIDGVDLGQIIEEEGRLPLTRVCRLGLQICASVAEAHALGVVHRDLKPENLMITRKAGGGERLKVLDFGLAQLRAHDTLGSRTLTNAGFLIGTPYFMAPEQIRGEEVDPRSDLYSIAALLYCAWTGQPPFDAETPMGVLTRHLTEAVTPPSERIPPEEGADLMDRILLRAMDKDPAQRPPDAESLGQELAHLLRTLGEEPLESTPLSGDLTLPVSHPASAPARRRNVATRSDVDRYERRIRRRGYFAYGALFLLLVAFSSLTYWFGRTPVRSAEEPQEVEPNDRPSQARPILAGQWTKAFIGRRAQLASGDVDYFVIDAAGIGQDEVVEIEASGVEGIDLAIDLARSGVSTPLLTLDSEGRGKGEASRNVPLRSTRYLLRVRQVQHGNAPVENLTEPYRLRWQVRRRVLDEEIEFNDSLEQAQTLELGRPLQGWLGWKGDVDTFCLAPHGPAQLRLQGVDGLDLMLRLIDRRHGVVDQIDRGSLGEGEEARLSASDRGLCVEIRAKKPALHGPSAEAALAYRLEVHAAEEGHEAR